MRAGMFIFRAILLYKHKIEKKVFQRFFVRSIICTYMKWASVRNAKFETMSNKGVSKKVSFVIMQSSVVVVVVMMRERNGSMK